MDIESPRCVSEQLVVGFDESVSKIEWNDSFSSWTTETTVLKSAVLLLVGEEKSKEREVGSRLEQVQDRLRRLQRQSQEDVQEYKLRLREAKSECKEMLQKQYRVKRGRRSKPTVKELLVEESSKIIHYLREQNANLRQHMIFVKREMNELKVNNQHLEDANRLAAEAHEELETHIEGLQATNVILTDNIKIFKGHMATMKQECKMRHAYYQSEANTSRAYDQAVCKIIARAQERRAGDQLVENLIDHVLQGHTEACEARITTLSNAGIDWRSGDSASNLMEHVFPSKDGSSLSSRSSSSSSSSDESDDGYSDSDLNSDW
jgi:hypothetical protein